MNSVNGKHDIRCESVPTPADDHIQMGEINPSLSIPHWATRKERPDLFETFHDKQDGCKVVVKP